jgi:hypothetical protein
MEMMQNEMSARKGSLVEVVAEGDHMYVACVREPVPDLETLVLPRCKLQAANSQSQQFDRERRFPETTGAEVGEVAPAGSGMEQSYCCAIAVLLLW